jgi:hypothetical protein
VVQGDGDAPIAAIGGSEDVSRVEEILDRATAYFETCLWDSEVGARAQARLLRSGIESSTLRGFRVGYAPGNTRELLDHLTTSGYSPEELISAGLASRSDGTHVHVRFHARIMFPFAGQEGQVRGFAGLATHLGTSWSLWLKSYDRDHFATETAIFGLRQAAPMIAKTNRVLVVPDCVQVLALHQAGRRDAVAVFHSPITQAHLAQFAARLGVGDLDLERRDGRAGVVVVPRGTEIDDDAFAPPTTPAGISLIDSPRRAGRRQPAEPIAVPELDYKPLPARALVYAAGVLIGVGVPIGLLLVAAPHNEATRGSTPTLNLVIVGVVVAYLLLALTVSWISARVRARSRTRRMREPWARGSGEWQPAGWTHHRLEEILVGAALASAVTCVVLLMTIGGFLG